MTEYQFLRNICGYNELTTNVTINNELPDKLYNIRDMINWYEQFINSFWNSLPNNKDTSDIQDKIVYPKINEGIYWSVMKIDFQKAFTNYLELIISDSLLNIFKKYAFSISRSILPTSAKKFLYNYILTNLIIHYEGKEKLIDLRKKVYDDVLYLANNIKGNILKAEVDGVYIQTYIKEPRIYDVYGSISYDLYKYCILSGNILIASNSKKTIVKGLSKKSPNIYKNTIKQLLSVSKFKRDSIIDDFLFSKNQHILDWCFKSDDGLSVDLVLKRMNITVKTETPDDIFDLNNFIDKLNRIFYFKEIENIISIIFESLD